MKRLIIVLLALFGFPVGAAVVSNNNGDRISLVSTGRSTLRSSCNRNGNRLVIGIDPQAGKSGSSSRGARLYVGAPAAGKKLNRKDKEILLREHLLGIRKLSSSEIKTLDLNSDGRVDISDLIKARGTR
jgi:hypothetical protein